MVRIIIALLFCFPVALSAQTLSLIHIFNLLCKGSLKHCTQQLKKSPEEHIEDIINAVSYTHLDVYKRQDQG